MLCDGRGGEAVSAIVCIYSCQPPIFWEPLLFKENFVLFNTIKELPQFNKVNIEKKSKIVAFKKSEDWQLCVYYALTHNPVI